MRIDKTLKQFIATVLTIIMVVTVIPFVPVALGIETEEESGNFVYAEEWDNPKNYLHFTAVDKPATITIGADYRCPHAQFLYSTDTSIALGDWTKLDIDPTYGKVDGIPITINAGDTLYIVASTTGVQHIAGVVSEDAINHYLISVGGNENVKVSGNVMSLLSQTNWSDIELNEYEFSSLFEWQASLIDASELKVPATSLAKGCYYCMFVGCSNLITGPSILPATELAEMCYANMFNDCTSLKEAPKLPATTLSQYCYYGMFVSCSALSKAPELPAKTLAESCYYGMFLNCSSLSNITVGFTEWPAQEENGPLYLWLSGAPEVGTLYCSKTCDDNFKNVKRSESTIPKDWTISLLPDGDTPEGPGGEDTLKDCFNLTAVGGDVTIQLKAVPGQTRKELVYTTDGGTNWNSIQFSVPYSVKQNEKMYIRAQDKNDKFADNGGHFQFVFNGDGQVCADGSIMFLLTSSGALDAVPEKAFMNLFDGCTSLTSAPELPATTLATDCYRFMFNGCTSLTSAPELPATTLASNCYRSMFAGCTSLTSAPELLATTLAMNCYNAMFDGCVSLKKAPNLSADSLAEYCYYAMFSGCTAMTEGPSVLPAETAAQSCYANMFAGCSSLTSSPDICLLRPVANCCDNMFENASKLCKVTVHFESWNTATNNWLLGVAETGTFICPDGSLTPTRDASHVPVGWIVGESMTGYYANVVPGTITLKYSGVTAPAITSVTHLDGTALTGNDVVTQEGLKIGYKVPTVSESNKVAGCIYKITYTVDSKSYVMNVNTRIRYAEIVNDTSSLANAKTKAEAVLAVDFATVGDMSDLAFITSSSATTATVNLLTTQNNKDKLRSIINQNGAVDDSRSQDELDSAAAAIDSGRVDFLKNCSTQFLYLKNNEVKVTKVNNVKISSVSYCPEPKVMGGRYSFFEKECQGGMETIKNPAANGTIVELKQPGAYTFYVNALIDGVAKDTFAYVSVGDNAPSKEEIITSIAAFTNAKYAETSEGAVALTPYSEEGAIIVNGTNIDYVIASYSGDKEFSKYNDFVLAGYTGLSSITKNDLVDSVEFAGTLGVARNGNYSFFVSFENGQSVCTSVAITGAPEPVDFTSKNGNITWTAKRGAVVENMSYVLGNQMSNASSAGFLPIQSGTNQVAALGSNMTHTFKIRLLANGTRYTYYQTVESGECNTPAIVVMSSAIGVYPRGVANIESIAYAKGDIATWDDMTKADGVTYVPIATDGITLDKTEFDSGTYTFMFKIKDNNPYVYHVYSNGVF